MYRKTSSGQALVEYGLILVLVALASVVVLAVVGPSIGITFNNAADASNNPEVRAIQQRQTDIVRGTAFFETGSTLTNSPIPPGSTRTNTPVPPGSTNTPVPPGPTNTPVPPTAVVPTAVPTNTPTSTPTNTFTPVPTAVPEWTFCANENATCSFTGKKEVRYGENGFYFYAIFTNTTACSNAVFGDPLVGIVKHCYYRDTTLVPTATPDLNATALAYANGTATALANANATATASANATATANANATATASANATATASAKATATANAIATTIAGSNATATAIAALPFVSNWTFCANQGNMCSFSGTMEVRFGTGDPYITLIATNGINCTKAKFGGSGNGNHCDYRSQNSIQSVTAIRRASDRNKIDISIKLARPGSTVTITDSQSGQVLTNQACINSGTPTCTYTITLLATQTDAGMITVSGTDFNGQTYSVGYPAY